MIRPPPRSPLFPYTPLFRSGAASEQLARDVLARVHALGEVDEPRAERIGHRLDRELPAVDGVEREPAPPAIVVDEAHRRVAPGRLPRPPVLQDGDDDVMAFLEDVGLHLDDIANLTLDGVAAAVDGGSHVLDDDGAPEVAPHSGLPSHVSRDRCHYHRSTR